MLWTPGLFGDAEDSRPAPSEPGESGALLLRARAGDARAFEALLRGHERPVLRLAFRMLNDLEEAKDASQEVFMRFHRSLGSIDPARDPAPWLYRTTVNVCSDLGRRRRAVALVSFEEAPETAKALPSEDPLEGLQQEARRRELRSALAAVPDKERAALILRDVEGFTAAEAARFLGSSEATVRSQACRGRVRLRRILEGAP